MLRGSVVIFTGILSMVWLKQKLYAYHWVNPHRLCLALCSVRSRAAIARSLIRRLECSLFLWGLFSLVYLACSWYVPARARTRASMCAHANASQPNTAGAPHPLIGDISSFFRLALCCACVLMRSRCAVADHRVCADGRRREDHHTLQDPTIASCWLGRCLGFLDSIYVAHSDVLSSRSSAHPWRPW
jgi:hypothetical protein